MSARPDYSTITAYMAVDLDKATPERVLEMLRCIEERLLKQGLTLAGVIDAALNPHRVLGRMPSKPLAKATWRACASYLLSRRDQLPEKDVRHLRTCTTQQGYLRKSQMRWIYDIVARVEPAGCGTWGAPD